MGRGEVRASPHQRHNLQTGVSIGGLGSRVQFSALYRGVLTRIAIHCARCGQPFVLHQSCYRGHRYCGDLCRNLARRYCVQEARRRFRNSSEGRLDHRDAQRARRMRQATSVADHSSKNLTNIAPSKGHETQSYFASPAASAVYQLQARRDFHPLPSERQSLPRHPLQGAAARLWQALTLQRLADQACIFCGQSTGDLVGFMGQGIVARSRAPPYGAF